MYLTHIEGTQGVFQYTYWKKQASKNSYKHVQGMQDRRL